MKQKYLDFLYSLNSIADITIDNNLIKEIEETELLIPIVGSFSAGKTTLINSFLEDNILPTDLTPETALATEITYGDNYIEAVNEKNSDIYQLNEIQNIKHNAKNYKYLKAFIKNQKISQIEPLILVDMPGFNAPIKLHNEAIMNYLDKGVYFIIVMSVEEGSITKKLMQELELISEFRDFSFCISKINLKPQSEINKIKEYVIEQLEYLNYNKKIFLLDDSGLDEVIENINEDEIYKKLFLARVEDYYFQIESLLNTKISTLRNSKEESLQIIKSINQSIEKIEKEKEEHLQNIQKRYSSISISSIIDKVTQEIIINEGFLVDKLANKQNIEDDLNSIIRNVLTKEINKIFNNLTKNIINDFRVSIELAFNDFELDREWINKISQSVEMLIQKSLNGLERLSENLKNNKNKYRAITSILAITTNVLAPALEVAILFLPDILENIFRTSQEKKIKETIKSSIHTQIIPQISLKLKSELPVILDEEIRNLIGIISTQFEDKLKEKRDEIEMTLKEKEQNIENIEEEINLLVQKRDEIRKIANEFFEDMK